MQPVEFRRSVGTQNTDLVQHGQRMCLLHLDSISFRQFVHITEEAAVSAFKLELQCRKCHALAYCPHVSRMLLQVGTVFGALLLSWIVTPAAFRFSRWNLHTHSCTAVFKRLLQAYAGAVSVHPHRKRH